MHSLPRCEVLRDTKPLKGPAGMTPTPVMQRVESLDLDVQSALELREHCPCELSDALNGTFCTVALVLPQWGFVLRGSPGLHANAVPECLDCIRKRSA